MSTYKELKAIADLRYAEIFKMVTPFVEMADAYGELICKITELLGSRKPKSAQDRVVRDLYSDIFDFLYEAQHLAIAGKTNIAFPVARRAFESQSLLSAIVQDQSIAEKWSNGAQISNGDMRKYLSKAKLKEDETSLKELYKFFSAGTHPNRDLIPERFLGEGNEFTLGMIGRPSLILVTKHLIELTQLWFWFGATVLFFYKEDLDIYRTSLLSEYKSASAKAHDAKAWLVEQHNRLLKEESS